MSGGYFFRGSDRGRSVGKRRVHLSDTHFCDGETPYRFRVGLSNTLSLLGCSAEEIALYLALQSSDIARHYAHVSQASSKLNLMEYVMALAPIVAATISHLGNVQTIVQLLERCSYLHSTGFLVI